MATRRNWISQRKARRLKARVEHLERLEAERYRQWCRDYPGGTHIATIDVGALLKQLTAVHVARRLSHAVVVVDNDSKFELYALPAPVGTHVA